MAAPPCTLVIFGASGDLTKRLLFPSLYHLACDGLLPEKFAVLGVSMDALDDAQFREKMTAGVRTFGLRGSVDEAVWSRLHDRLYWLTGKFDDPSLYAALAERLAALQKVHGTEGNVLFYFATPPSVFGMLSQGLEKSGLTKSEGWRRVIVEKPFGHDLPSAIALGNVILTYWREDQVFRIDHYLGKETVQNLLAFRFANGMFEPLWNRHHVDHIQFTAAEAVGVEGRGGYYEHSGVLRDMLQNHMFQMLAYLCMEPPTTLSADDVRDQKSQLLRAVRPMTVEDARKNTIRGQYGPGKGPDGKECVGYRQETSVNPKSATETFAAMRLFIDNWRWEGVPIYLRSGKRLWKKGTEIIVQFRTAPDVMLRGAGTGTAPNRLIFHIQPDQGIELRIIAKVPGPALEFQDVNLRFAWADSFHAARATGYEVLLYHAMIGDSTLFSRTDLVEAAWRIAQPVLDAWTSEVPKDFPNYAAGTWGPHAAYEMMARDGRRWIEVPNRDILARVPLFASADPVLLTAAAMALRPMIVSAGSTIIRSGDPGQEMYILARGEVDVVDDSGTRKASMKDGTVFGEVALLLPVNRTATVRARTDCDLLVLSRHDFERVLRENPGLAKTLLAEARKNYGDLPGLAAPPQ